MPPVVTAAWTNKDCFASSLRAIGVGEEIREQRHFSSHHLQTGDTGGESNLEHSRRMKETESDYNRSIAGTGQAAGAKVQEGESMADHRSQEQDVKIEQNPTVSSPASFASQEERHGRSADVPCSGPTYSEPTPGLFGSGLSARVYQTNRKRKRKDMPVFHSPSLGGASAGGACDHCGRRNSPAWRRGPPNKPHLCNACGVRFLGKGTLDGYMPGMKQHKDDHVKEDADNTQGDDEVYDDTDSAKTTMPQLSGKAVSRRQRTPRRMATPRSDMVSGPAAIVDPESDGEEAGSIATWSDYIKKAVETHPENWRKVVTLIKAAIRVAKADPSTSQNVLTELDRGQALFWMDKDAALKVLSDVAEADMLLTLSGGQVNDAVGRQSRGTPPAGSEEDGGSCFAYCGACGKPRLTSRWPAVYEDFRCGGAMALHPERSCLAPADITSGSAVAPPPVSSFPKRRRLTTTTAANPKTIAGGEYSSDLGMLADVSVEGTVQPKGRGKRAAPAVQPANGRGQSSLDTFQRAEEAAHFMTLPIGWRMEVVYERVAGGKGVAVETVYVSPNRARFKSMADVVAWMASPSNRARLLAGPAAATFTPGPAFHRSPSGSVLVSHSGGPGSPKAENLVQPETSPRMSRADLSLTHLAAVAGQISREASPLPGGVGPGVQSPTLGFVGRTMAAKDASSPKALAANAAPQDQGDAFTFRHGSAVPGTPTIMTPIVTLRRPEQAMPPNVKIVVAPARPVAQIAPAASTSIARQSRSHMQEPEPASVGVPPACLWKQKSEPAAVLHDMSRGAKRRPEEVVTETPSRGVVAPVPQASELRTPDLPATRPQTIGRWRTFPPNGAAADGLNVERDSKEEVDNKNNFDMGVRALMRCVSEPTSAIKAYAADSKISWTGVVRIQKGDNSSEDLCTMLANLPEQDAVHLPGNLFISSFKPRNDIFMAAVTDQPLLLHLGPCTEKQRETLLKMEEEKVAAVVQLEAFDFALIPHINRKNGLHIVGLKQLQQKGSAAVGSTSPSGSGSPSPGIKQHPLFMPLNSGVKWESRLSAAPASADVPPSRVRPPSLFRGHPRPGG